MRAYLLLALIFLTPFTSVASEREKIIAVMQKQQLAWNAGDLESFMQGYWKSEKLQFIGKKGINYGWQATLDSYKKSYPDRAAMGTLHFDILQVETMNDNAFVLGKWKLTRVNDILSGFYTLYWKKIADQWLIVIDHSS